MALKRVRSALLWACVLAVAGAALWSVGRRTSWPELWVTLRHARGGHLLLACAIFSLSYYLRGLRWRVLLAVEPALPVALVFWASMVGYLGNFYLPARAGEVLRSTLLGRRAGISPSYVLATALTERIADVAALAAISLLSVLALRGLPAWLSSAALLAGALALLGLAGLALASHYRAGFVRFTGRLPLPSRYRAGLAELADQFLLGLRAIHRPSRALLFAALTAAIWLGDGLASVVVAVGLSQSLSLLQAVLLLAALGVASTVPSTPGAVGVYQFVAVGLLPLFGYSPSSALAYILVAQACSYVVVTLWGGLGLWFLNAGPRGGAARESR